MPAPTAATTPPPRKRRRRSNRSDFGACVELTADWCRFAVSFEIRELLDRRMGFAQRRAKWICTLLYGGRLGSVRVPPTARDEILPDGLRMPSAAKRCRCRGRTVGPHGHTSPDLAARRLPIDSYGPLPPRRTRWIATSSCNLVTILSGLSATYDDKATCLRSRRGSAVSGQVRLPPLPAAIAGKTQDHRDPGSRHPSTPIRKFERDVGFAISSPPPRRPITGGGSTLRPPSGYGRR